MTAATNRSLVANEDLLEGRKLLDRWSNFVLVLVGLVILLLEFDGIRQPEWPEWINLSTIVSMFSTTLRTLLVVVIASVLGQEKWIWFDRVRPLRHLELFEQASQGPWGSFTLLFRTWTAHLASLAAILMVVSLATGSFLQQTLRTSVCQKPSGTSLGTLAIATRAPMNDLIQCGVRSFCASPGLRAAIVGGIMDPGSTTESITYDCPTGNCTFKEQLGVTSSSIAYCSACDDVTESIEELAASRMMTGTTGFGIIAFTLAGCLIPDNPDLTTTANCTGTPEHSMLPNLPQDANIMAAKCHIFPCLRNYHSSVVNGRLHETVVSAVRANKSNGLLSHVAAHPSKDIPVVKLPCIVDGELYDATNISMVPPLPSRNFTDLWQDGIHLIAPWECTYFLNPAYGQAITADTQRMFNGSCGTSAFSQIPPAETICPEENWTMAPLFGGGATTFNLIEGFFENMTLAMTNRLRNTGAVVHDAQSLQDYNSKNVTSPGTINGIAWETMSGEWRMANGDGASLDDTFLFQQIQLGVAPQPLAGESRANCDNVNVAVNEGYGHSLVINVQLGDYPYTSENVTFSNATCIAVLTHVRTECVNLGGNLKLSRVNGAIHDETSSSKRRSRRDQPIDGNDRAFSDTDDEGDDEGTSDSDSEGETGDLSDKHVQGDVSGIATTTTVISLASSTSTYTTISTSPNTMMSFTTSTTTRKKHKTSGGKKYKIIKTTETETTSTTQTISTTANASTTETITATSSSPPPTSSSTINTDDFHGWVKIDPQQLKCSSTSTSSS
ncbi:hypothetical protein INS49_004886 [Diaporthe citri]|uniref:uncharacterized protein n=1 Tax=Diaporthe citri TaxID=83186 RepID=UPI001C81A93C|nr:uncharacterized protein INS49_004886 [Diaporthe citri]KAG6354281.1 hypothetical protein INS49_004886 [Diaporthe citri]